MKGNRYCKIPLLEYCRCFDIPNSCFWWADGGQGLHGNCCFKNIRVWNIPSVAMVIVCDKTMTRVFVIPVMIPGLGVFRFAGAGYAMRAWPLQK